MDNFENLEPSKHLLEFFSENPYKEIRLTIENALKRQVSDCILKAINVSSQPFWLSAFCSDESDSSHSILTKAAVSFDLELLVSEPNQPLTKLQGIYSWVGINLDRLQSKQKVWFDLNETIKNGDDFKTKLTHQMYSLENN